MRQKRIIIIVVAGIVIVLLAGLFFLVKYNVLGGIDDAISRYFVQSQSDEEAPEELKYETEHDKDGNEYVVEYRKQIVTNLETGEEVEMWEDTADPKKIYDNYYKGKIEKIEDNKIYFTVDKEDKSGGGFSFKDDEDYEIVFDINTYDFEDEPSSHYWCDSIIVIPKDPLESGKFLYSAGELEFLVGESVMVQDAMREDYYTGDIYKDLDFYLK